MGRLRQRFPPIWRILAAFSLVLVLCAAATAQETPRARIDAIKAQIGEVDTALKMPELTDAALQELRTRIDPVQDKLRAIIAEETPRLEAAKSRLDQLGPKPDPAKGQTESADVTRERAEQEKQKAESDDVLRLARLLSVQADQLQAQIAERRRAAFTSQLFKRNFSILNPMLWLRAVRALPREGTVLKSFAAQQMASLRGLDRTQTITLAGILVVLVAGLLPFRRLIRRLDSRDPQLLDPSRRQRATAALRIIVLRAAASIIFAVGATELVDLFGVAEGGLSTILSTLFWGLAIIFMVRGLAKAVLAPEAPAWRLFGDNESSVTHLTELALLLPGVLVLGKLLDAVAQVIYAALPITVVIKGTIAALVALLTLRALSRMQAPGESAAEGGTSMAPAVPTRVPFRLLVGSVALLVLAADVLGYVALASFLLDQMLWVVCVGTLLAVTLVLVDEVVGRELTAQGRLGAFARATIGVEAGSLEQLSILSCGVLRLIIWVIAVFLLLAPWGVDSSDAFATLRAAFFGFSIGGVTISLSTIVMALGLFVVGLMVTRGIQGWLDTRYLPATGLDQGLRNSIRTIFGYLGVILVAIVALAQLGLSLEKLTIVAGALSVGIGFGLQSIVNNFVSGLILLWERPIRVGDWIVVGDEQGIVKRINVRATEIETFDRASLIVPNAEFISGRVKNWMHNDRLGRVIIPVGVAYGADPEVVRQLLLDVALGHREVLSEPKPRVFFVKFGDSSIDFELRCYTDIDGMLGVKSDLLFAIFKRLTDEKIDIPFPHRTLQIDGLDRLLDTLVTRGEGDPPAPAGKNPE